MRRDQRTQLTLQPKVLPAPGEPARQRASSGALAASARPQLQPPSAATVTSSLAIREAPRSLTPLQRLQALCDPGSLYVIRSIVGSHSLSGPSSVGDGVVGASGTVDGRPVFCYAEDGHVAGGSLGRAHAETIVRVLELAGDARAPVVGFIESAGARMQEGALALAAYGKVFKANVALSGRVPQISIITGLSAGGGCYSPALTDFVMMAGEANMFLTGPGVVREVTGEDVSASELGGTRVHERNGVCHLVADSVAGAAAQARALLSYLPQHAGERPPLSESVPPPRGDPSECLPPERSRVYDVREVIERVVDGASQLELAPKWARNIVTTFARLDGEPVGVIANQPRHLGGVIDAAASEKGARFVRTCNAYGLPLIVLVDTPGFMPGTKQESAGAIRRGAKLLYAFIEADVPRVTVVLRQAYGGGFITMNSKEIGADFAFAWPRTTIGVMGARQAIGIIHRRTIAASEHPEQELRRLAEDYAVEHQGGDVAAREGVIDELLLPQQTRARLIAALASLRMKRRSGIPTGNIPL